MKLCLFCKNLGLQGIDELEDNYQLSLGRMYCGWWPEHPEPKDLWNDPPLDVFMEILKRAENCKHYEEKT
jgi:hypothetical protein